MLSVSEVSRKWVFIQVVVIRFYKTLFSSWYLTPCFVAKGIANFTWMCYKHVMFCNSNQDICFVKFCVLWFELGYNLDGGSCPVGTSPSQSQKTVYRYVLKQLHFTFYGCLFIWRTAGHSYAAFLDFISWYMNRYRADTEGSSTPMVTPSWNMWNTEKLQELPYCSRTTKQTTKYDIRLLRRILAAYGCFSISN